MPKKSVLHIVDFSMTGGKQKVALNVILNESFSNQYAQSVFNTERKAIREEYKKVLGENNIRLYESNILFPGEKKLLRKIALLKTILKVRPQIIILWSVLPTPVHFLITKLLNIKTVFWDHGVSRHRSPEKSGTFSLKRCDLVLCNSESTKMFLKKRWSVDKVEVCHNPIRKDVVPDKLPNRTLSDKSIKLGFAGRLVPLKGVGLVIEAVQILKNRGVQTKLLIAGEKNEEYDFLINLSKKLDVESQVHFLGNLSDMGEYYRSIDIFICPSLSEPFGLVSVEAAANGCPVVISNIDGLSETVEDGITGIAIEPEMPMEQYRDYVYTMSNIPDAAYYPGLKRFDSPKAVYPQQIADSVIKITGTRKQYEKFSETSHKRAIEKFSLGQHMDCVMKKLKKLH